MDEANESHVEHQEFLSMWLLKFVFFARSHKLKRVLSVAIHLPRVTKINLAVVVLTSIHRFLCVQMNNKIRIVTKVYYFILFFI